MSWRSVARDCQPWAVNAHPPWGSSGEQAERHAHPWRPLSGGDLARRPVAPPSPAGSWAPVAPARPGGEAGFYPGAKGAGAGARWRVEAESPEASPEPRAQSPEPSADAQGALAAPRTAPHFLPDFLRTNFSWWGRSAGRAPGMPAPTERLLGPPALVACGEGADTFSSPSPQIPGTPSSPPGRSMALSCHLDQEVVSQDRAKSIFQPRSV